MRVSRRDVGSGIPPVCTDCRQDGNNRPHRAGHGVIATVLTAMSAPVSIPAPVSRASPAAPCCQSRPLSPSSVSLPWPPLSVLALSSPDRKPPPSLPPSRSPRAHCPRRSPAGPPATRRRRGFRRGARADPVFSNLFRKLRPAAPPVKRGADSAGAGATVLAFRAALFADRRGRPRSGPARCTNRRRSIRGGRRSRQSSCRRP